MTPRITFGIIVLNGEPFTRYNLSALYPFAHQIIVVEGACPSAKSFATPDGHSCDGTLQTLRQFQQEDDPEHKVIVVTAEDEGHSDGFWTEKDEMSQAYARRATGDYLWQVDMDEFYRPDDLHHVQEMLRQDPGITTVTFQVITFWGGLGYRTDGIALRREAQNFHRLFAWKPTYHYATHRPPTVVDESGRDLRALHPISAENMANQGIYLYHYSFLFPFQADFKLAYYGGLGEILGDGRQQRRQDWRDNYFSLTKPFYIDDTSILGEASWLRGFPGRHPEAINQLWADIDLGKVPVTRRPVDDIEHLLNKWWYQMAQKVLPGAVQVQAALFRAARLLKRAGRFIIHRADEMPLKIRAVCLSVPGISAIAKKSWSLQGLALRFVQQREAARREQFSEWHPEDILAKIQWYGQGNWSILVPETPSFTPPGSPPISGASPALLVAARRFFEAHTAAQAKPLLKNALETLQPGAYLMLYAPHEFAFRQSGDYPWIPRWQEICDWAEIIQIGRIVDYNPGFDRNGFFHVIIERKGATKQEGEQIFGQQPVETAYYFYMDVGTDLTQGHSAKVLSASGLRVVKQLSRTVIEHSFSHVPQPDSIHAGDLAIGHYGPWITLARRAKALTVLYGPSDRFRDVRHDEQFYIDLQSQGTFKEQYRAAQMVILQSGGCWRVVDPYVYPGLCRWIDLPISEAVFPRTKKSIAPAGQRIFCFINLYNDDSKGAAVARKIAEHCPEHRFMAIRCPPFHLPNVQEHPGVDNRSAAYRRLVTQADFLITPAWEDPQPGTVAECGALGLLPILSEYAGYVLSFPRRLDLHDMQQCSAVLQDAQSASVDQVLGWQALNAEYIERYHRIGRFNTLFSRYIREALDEYQERK